MDPTLVVMAVRAALRLVRTGEQAFGQYARDRDAILKTIEKVDFAPIDTVRGFFRVNPELVPDGLQAAWKKVDGAGAGVVPREFDLIAAAYARAQALQKPALSRVADEYGGLFIVKQWGSGAEPPSPVARVVLTIVDVAAEFASQDPQLFGVSGNAEVLVRALATHIAEFIPDDTNELGPKNLLGERLASQFLKAALSTLNEHPDAVIDQQHVQQLVKSTLPKLIASFPTSLDQ